MANLFSRRRAMGGLTALLTLSLVFLADLASAQSVTGSYRVEGRNPDGSAYSGRVQISGTAKALVVEWQVANQRYTGKGSRNGDVVWIDWGQRYPVVYLRMPSGELHGTWANGRGLERLIP
ncbi:LIC10280 family protein [Pseudophaeobacter flagellatus]|uniref:LIC10280 family protein n=1 Tax=Pseudophaeobacter flagellatus TaxID=2899119 RepID=UPI001E3761C2|nr:hypothetical protein [Pseudophaeobacter flagellatus]MCD9148176.1 hypothetical protein [Pseudophaeobacter flagellatus]